MLMFRPTYNYENNEVRRKDSPSPTAPYDTIPDLPPPDAAFPNLFENLPSSPYGKPGGFFGSFNTEEKDFSATPNSYSSKSQPTKGIFGCESSPISRNVRSLVSQSVSPQMQKEA